MSCVTTWASAWASHPEIALGESVDGRTDLYALGIMFYEMLTARQTFAGDSVTDLLSSVTRDEPDWTALPAAVPASSSRYSRSGLRAVGASATSRTSRASQRGRKQPGSRSYSCCRSTRSR